MVVYALATTFARTSNYFHISIATRWEHRR